MSKFDAYLSDISGILGKKPGGGGGGWSNS